MRACRRTAPAVRKDLNVIASSDEVPILSPARQIESLPTDILSPGLESGWQLKKKRMSVAAMTFTS